MRTIGVLTSGGDAPGMNAAIRAVVRGAIYNDMKVYGIQEGFQGMIEGRFVELNARSVGDILQKGGTFLHTARSEEFRTPEGREKALQNAKLFGLDGLVVIGGDGSLHGGLELAKKGLRVIGLPGTIDNDLAYTDTTIGFDTAVNTALDAVAKIRDTSEAHGRITVVEVMGRNCGDIALYAGIAGGADVVLAPEIDVDMDEVVLALRRAKAVGKRHNMVIRAEGFPVSLEELTGRISEGVGEECRSVVLGYIQRGGAPSASDRILASRLGYRAAELLMEDGNSRAVGIRGGEIIDVDLEEALKMERTIDTKLMRLVDILSI